jgi:hypothetical protein
MAMRAMTELAMGVEEKRIERVISPRTGQACRRRELWRAGGQPDAGGNRALQPMKDGAKRACCARVSVMKSTAHLIASSMAMFRMPRGGQRQSAADRWTCAASNLKSLLMYRA